MGAIFGGASGNRPGEAGVKSVMSTRFLGLSLLAFATLSAGCAGVHGANAPTVSLAPAATTHPVGLRPTGPSGSGCHALSIDIAPGVKGEKTAQTAISAFLRSGTAEFSLPTSGWHGPATGGRFASGAAALVVYRLPGGRGFVVNGASDC